ncbi:peptidylprolyl isomerase [Mesonia maritima]|uniref:Peptidyl-prolyl cis-trans isomerase SurA n=1 Tax=Mesonia maritima TaxID=1793873 RepID=A0ABU1K4E5_9FLAO|nr:peptidylprolyl isomerase [Mesonia maritima]MDR6300466.1 peptidyl-prolyl cis-trans isomerase SurA [Mesonia maritima]
MKKIFALLFILAVSFATKAQEADEVLMTIDNKPIYRSEFEQVFSKNLKLIEDKSQEDVDNYIDLFVNYQLKLMAAEKMGLDTLETFQREFSLYKNQLAKKYLKDSEVTEKLVNEAYKRLQEEINASHILVQVSDQATAKDTLKAYKKIEEARNKILSGEDFVTVAKEYSEDPSVRANEGNVGWFSVFKMVYPFETAAYNTKEGEISKPFKTRFGYHLVKINKRRKNDGEVNVAHILLNTKDKDSVKVKQQIELIYDKLQNGADFADLAKQFSEDENTAVNGGKLRAFMRGTLNSETFQEKAFALQDSADITEPFQTKYGWHIIKLFSKKPIGSLEEERPHLENKIKSDSRSQLINENLIEDIEELYAVKENENRKAVFEKFSNKIDPKIENADELLIAINGEGKTFQEFADFVEKKYSVSKRGITDLQIQKAYENYKNDFLVNYHKAHLAETNPEYASIVKEYKNGLLLFDLMQKKIWNPATEDTLALKKFYENYKENYIKATSYDAVIYSSEDKKTVKKVRRELKNEDSKEIISEKFDKVIITEGKFTENSSALPEKFKANKGISKVYKNNGVFLVVSVHEKEEKRQKTFEEARGAVISDYQNTLEKEWLKSLREKHDIEINKKVLEKTKRKFE